MHVICYTVFTIYQGTGNKHSTPLFIPRAVASRARGLDLLRGRRPLDNLHTEKKKNIDMDAGRVNEPVWLVALQQQTQTDNMPTHSTSGMRSEQIWPEDERMEEEEEEVVEEEGRGGAGLTVRCRHQGLELLGLGRRLWPGAGSHGDLRSSGRPAAEKEKKRKRKARK